MPREVISWAMRKLGVEEWLVSAVMSKYAGAKTVVRTVYGNSEGLEVKVGMNQSQNSIAKNLRCDELLYYTFIIHSAGEIIFLRLVNIWRSYGQNR